MNKVEMTGTLVRESNFKVSDKGNAFLTNSIAITEGKDKKEQTISTSLHLVK